MANPTDTGRFGHRQGVFLENITSAEPEIWCDRIQMADPEDIDDMLGGNAARILSFE